MFPNSVSVFSRTYIPKVVSVHWRVRHDDPPLWRKNLPEVNRILPFHAVPLNEGAQWLWRNLNPQLTNEQWRRCLGNTLALTNGTGFPGHADYVNWLDLDMPDPRFDLARVFGGYVLREKWVAGNNMYFEAIDVRKPLPSVQDVLDNHLYGEAVNIDDHVTPTGTVPIVRPFKSNWELPVYVPLLVAVDEPYYHIVPERNEEHAGLEKLPAGEFPSPFRYP